ncbi:MAG: hypothetical protein LBG72_05485 [Spirochaetaceae bacterium]|jgi:hypothetical protein|nr:hypothetical protein [Spirochaetaceae bacterium]
MKKLSVLLAAVCAAFVFAACQDVLFDEETPGNKNTNEVAVTGITLDKSVAFLSVRGGGGEYFATYRNSAAR